MFFKANLCFRWENREIEIVNLKKSVAIRNRCALKISTFDASSDLSMGRTLIKQDKHIFYLD